MGIFLDNTPKWFTGLTFINPKSTFNHSTSTNFNISQSSQQSIKLYS